MVHRDIRLIADVVAALDATPDTLRRSFVFRGHVVVEG
jgi:hypothetical protein